jgi:beta-barrel assembly-enhancing protease
MPDAHPPNALCFGSDLSAEGTPCHAVVIPDGIAVELPGFAPERVAFTSLTVDSGGFDHDHLVLRWLHNGFDRRLYLKDAGVIVAFRRLAPLHLSAAVEQTVDAVRRGRRRRRTVLAIALASTVAAVLALWFGFDALVAVAVNRIPVGWEQEIGEAARRQFLENQSIVEGGPAVEAVNEITRRLVESIPHTPYQFQVTVVRNNVVNAFALPGGYVIVYTGLMKTATGPDEVAGVLSHELNHVLLRHALKRVVKNVGFVAIVTIVAGGQEAVMRLLRRLIIELTTLRFSREQEMEADLSGLRLLQQAKVSPAGLIVFFERLSSREQPAVELLSTHPMSTARAERLKSEAAALGPPPIVPFTFDWGAVQQSLQ